MQKGERLMFNNDVISAMNKDRRTTREYFDGYMETIELGKVDALKMEVTLDTKAIEEQADLLMQQTHMAGNPIYSKEFDIRKKEKYNRSSVKKETQKAIDDYEKLSDEELDSLTF